MKKKKTTTTTTKKKTVSSAVHKQSMKDVYYDPSQVEAFGGKARLHKRFSRNQVDEWLPTQLAYSLHKPIRKSFPTRAYRVAGIDDTWQMDMLEMIPYAKVNKGYKYILVCIDVFSRFVRALPCKTKIGDEVATTMLKMIKTAQPKRLQTDRGKEFYNTQVRTRVLEKYGIHLYTVNSQFKAAIVERFNRTLREKLNRYFTHTGRKVWHDVLSQFVDAYNKSKHRGIFGMRPIDVTSETESQLWSLKNTKSLSAINEKTKKEKPLNLLDYVRISLISMTRLLFNRNFDQNWSDEVFRIVGVDTKSYPTMYIIEDENGNVVDGKFYKAELQLINVKPEMYRIEKVLRTKGKGAYKQYFVKWHGYSKEHNSWIKASQLEKNA